MQLVRSWTVVLAVVAAAGAIFLAAAWWPRAEVRRDAASPARRFTAEQLGPSVQDVIDRMGEKGYPSPKGTTEF
jgi:hypothetical protein